jgi:BirA family biotin operon repressor/biotin-[acetyl-CoA-carboxylase] ligase
MIIKHLEDLRLIILDEVDSTNTYLKNNFDSLEDGSCVAALKQTAGRGRIGRKWLTGEGQNIAFSFKASKLKEPFHGGVLLGLASLLMLREVCPEGKFFFKWPNDIYALDLTGTSALKLSGILSEAVWEKGALKGVVSGIGINVNFSEKELENAGQPAISLSIIKKSKFDVIFLVEKLAKFLKECYIKYDCNFQEVLDLWKEENRLIGQIIEAVTPTGEAHVGVFKDILPDGAMLLEENGVEFRFDCGDIKLNTKRIDFKQLEREKKL